MQLHTVVNMFGADLQRRYGEKIHKITLHGGFSCPNRDGTLGRGGCTFCNVASFADENAQYDSIEDQLSRQSGKITRAKRYLAYFQAYTSTYAEVELLREMYESALTQADVVGLCVGTRPDCVPEAVLELLQSYQQQGYEVWLELGLQTAHDKTLKRINRGHDFACYQATTRAARERGLKVCCHLITGLREKPQPIISSHLSVCWRPALKASNCIRCILWKAAPWQKPGGRGAYPPFLSKSMSPPRER